LLINNENVNTEARQDGIPVTAHLITPYGSNMNYIAETLQSFFGADDESTEELEGFAKMVEENCIEDFNGECGLIPEYFTLGGITADLDSDSVTQTFIADRNPDCFDLSNPELIEQCQRESIGATTTEQPREVIRILGARLGWMIRKLQETFRGYGSKAYEYIKECKRTEDLFLGRCLGYQGLPGGSDQQVANSCNDYANTEVKLPASLTELGNVICKVANNNAKDVQLLWGITQIEGHTMNDLIGKESSVPCADLIDSERCGASMITGLIVPQCINPDAACSVGWATAEGTAAEKYRQELTNEVVCSVEGQLAYILKTRKSQIGELQALWRSVHGSNPSTDQLYYMMAGKNLGLENQYLTQPACGNAPGIDPAGIGCSEDNYCVCAMDRFTYQCGQTV
jgi:hypothetical protein